jgi:hypothetical protein
MRSRLAPDRRGGTGAADLFVTGESAGAWWWWRRHAPAHHDHFAFGARVAYDWSWIRETHQALPEVADIAVHHPEERDDGRLVGRDRIDCTS